MLMTGSRHTRTGDVGTVVARKTIMLIGVGLGVIVLVGLVALALIIGPAFLD